MNARTAITVITVIEQISHEFDSAEAAANYLLGVSSGPVVEAPVVEAPAPRDPLENLLNLLEDPRFTLRTVTSLEAKTGVSWKDIEFWLQCRGIGYVVKTRRGSGDLLVGLASRN